MKKVKPFSVIVVAAVAASLLLVSPASAATCEQLTVGVFNMGQVHDAVKSGKMEPRVGFDQVVVQLNKFDLDAADKMEIEKASVALGSKPDAAAVLAQFDKARSRLQSAAVKLKCS